MDTQPHSSHTRSAAAPDYAAFGIGLFRRLADDAPDENVVISPVSAGLALGMLANGATGQTLAEIENVLAMGLELDALNQANAALFAALRTEDVELAIASSLWARGGTPLLPPFVERVGRIYGAQTEALDFASEEAVRRINGWVEDHTNGRITEMVTHPINPLVILLLLNAVYFKGRWADEFDPEATRPRTFHAPSGPVERRMMSRKGLYDLLRGEGFKALRLPYRGDRFAMYVLLPDRGQDLARLRERLAKDAWDGWMRGFGLDEVLVVMPRFRIEVASRLNHPLQAMGMEDAFISGHAALDGMLPAEYVSRVEPYVSEVLQKVFVEVNEEGTEAAAVTMAVMAGRSMAFRTPEFIVDRPFLFAIRDDTTGALLFVGQVNDPEEG